MTVTSPHPTVSRAGERAREAALNVLLRCWLRETGQPVAQAGTIRVPLRAGDLAVHVVRPSPTGAHQITCCLDSRGRVLTLEEVAAALTEEAAARRGLQRTEAEDARRRIVESGRRSVAYAEARATDGDATSALPPWLEAEQGLLAGHPWHPMTKSRDGLPDDEDARYAPEARGRFRLHWYAASPDVVATDSTALDVTALMRRLAGDVTAPGDWLLVPAHPWQAARLRGRPGADRLFASGDLVDLGPGGEEWWPTSSLRTVARPDEAVMLKLSLGLRVTNSRRENLRSELALASRTAALVDAGLGHSLATAHPQFQLIKDPAWIGVDGLDGPIGLDTVVREQPFLPTDDVWCAGALVDARPDLGEPVAAHLVRALATRAGWSTRDAAAHWYRRWLDAVAEPLLWLHGRWGVALEAHLQNVLVGLDDGVPVRGWYRDNQGWYAAASKVERLDRMLPNVGDGVPLVFDDALVAERLVYYLAVNHLFGVSAALAGADLTTEEHLLCVLVDFLRDHLRGPDPSPVAAMLLAADSLQVKANLLTAVDGRDELTGTVESQSVYVPVPNPLKEVLR